MKEIIRLTSMQNPQVKLWRALREHKGREEQHLFIAEGDHLTGEALNARAAQTLLVAEDALDRFPEHINMAQKQGISVYALPAHVFASLCDTKTPQGVCAVCRLPDMDRELPGDALKIAALDGVQDPGNVGTVLRTLDAAGFDALLINDRTADPYGPKALRASMGAVFRIPVFHCDLPVTLAGMADRYDLYAGMLDGSTPFFERQRSRPGVCVIIGNEGAGISKEVAAVKGLQKVRLPMEGGAESLNASVAGAIMIYDIIRCGK